MQPWFITATNTGVGKTHITCRLLDALDRRGLTPGVLKPIETGVDSIPEDATKLKQHCSKINQKYSDLTLEDICPYQFTLPAAPYVAKKKNSISIEKIHKAVEKITRISDIVLIEGAGGLMVPIEKEFFMVDMIKALDAKALLVSSSKLGSINDTLLSINMLEQRGIPYQWCINLYEDRESFAEVTLPYYQDRFGEVFVLPEDEEKLLDTMLT